MVFSENMTIEQKLAILSDAAKYDVSCTSSGVNRSGKDGMTGNTAASGICHAFSADGRCISLLKILFTNECIYDCKYCINRSSNDVVRTTFTPEEVCNLTMEFYRRNYIEGLFLSSGIIKSPNHTMELITQTLFLLRTKYHFNGYIHCKAIPGAASELIEKAGWYADRMSVNLELPTAEGLKQLAPNKSRKNILLPIRQIQEGVKESRQYLGMKGGNQSVYWYTHQSQKQNKIENRNALAPDVSSNQKNALSQLHRVDHSRGFVPAGQSTQMIIGATMESDFEILNVTEALYRHFDLKRVFYSAFIRVNEDSSLPVLPGGPPLLREHRLYQADWLLRYYGFEAGELLSKERPNFNPFLDPKCNWAIGHMDQFPIEVNAADYFTLLRIPGIGPKSAKRIVKARSMAQLTFDDLKKFGVVLKRAVYFITCGGKMFTRIKLDEDYITQQMIGLTQGIPKDMTADGLSYRQVSLFDDVSLMG